MPYDPVVWLAYLRARAITGVEAVGRDRYQRSMVVEGQPTELLIDFESVVRSGLVRVSCSADLPRDPVEVIVSRFADLGAPTDDIAAVLSGDDVLAPLVRAHPGLRIPGSTDSFELAVRAILGQQVSVSMARTLAARVAGKFGSPAGLPHCNLLFPGADVLATAKLETVGVSPQRANAIRELAGRLTARSLSLDSVGSAESAREGLLSVKGIGPWTAAYVGLRGLGDPDSIPSSDLGLMKVFGVSRQRDLESRAEAWRPYRGYAAVYAWTRFLDTTPPDAARA
jgi:AraC family transcriptional regulator of adaptative response / DNA-3-methyladenine glycosylase II